MVVFKNTDDAAHSFTSDKFDSQIMINDGMEFHWTVEEGVTTYSCLLHPWSTGTIIGVVAPGIDSIKNYPDWVVNIFNWYDEDLIDYDTLMNALIWLMGYGIVQDISEPEPEPVTEVWIEEEDTKPVVDSMTEQEIKCLTIYTKNARLANGCPWPIP
jgi:hypothetical protein